MGRKPVYANAAERQKAYRDRPGAVRHMARQSASAPAAPLLTPCGPCLSESSEAQDLLSFGSLLPLRYSYDMEVTSYG